MLDASQNARLKELAELIEKERDHDKFTKLIAELNALLDEQRKSVNKCLQGRRDPLANATWKRHDDSAMDHRLNLFRCGLVVFTPRFCPQTLNNNQSVLTVVRLPKVWNDGTRWIKQLTHRGRSPTPDGIGLPPSFCACDNPS